MEQLFKTEVDFSGKWMSPSPRLDYHPKMYNYRFFSLASLLDTSRTTPTERLYNSLRHIEPQLEDMSCIRRNPHRVNRDPELLSQLIMSGCYCLYDDNTLLSVLIIDRTCVRRVITLPRFRHQGHASRLLTYFADRVYDCGLFAFSPVDPAVEPLFEGIGWVRSTHLNSDGTHDYHPASHTAYDEYVARVNPEGADHMSYLLHLARIRA